MSARPGPAFDLLAAYLPDGGAFFERGGFGIGAGPGTQIPTSDGSSALGPSDVALGVLPFAGEGSLLVPSKAVRRTASGDVVGIGASGAPFERVVGSAPHAAFSQLQLSESPSASAYAAAVERATALIREGELQKVVLARTIEVNAGRMLDPRRLAQRLRAVNPDAYTFAMPTPTGVMVGASPELLVSRFGLEVRCNPLAGSAPRSGDADEDRASGQALASSAKNLEEHAIVVEAVADTLRPACEQLGWDPEPVLLETPNVWQLSTRFHVVLREPALTALDLALALHPTPAVAGTPTAAALSVIGDIEPFDRGSYAGPVGWIDASGDGEWAIALRCAELHGERATLYAGAGIVAGSDPAAEVDETGRKFRAFLDALRWG